MNTQKTTVSVLLAFLLAGLLLAGCRGGDKQAGPPAGGPPEVEVVTLAPESVSLSEELPGRTTAFRIAEVRPQVSGIILKRHFEEGTEVKAGQLLYKIDPAVYQAAFDSARAALARAEASENSARLKAERYRKLVDRKAVSDQDQVETEAAWKQAQAEIAAARAAVDSARINLAYTDVKAPISGRIGRALVTEGALVGQGEATALAVVQQIDPVYVNFTQSAADVFQLRRAMESGQFKRAGGGQGASVKLVLSDGSEYAQAGKLLFTDLSVDSTTGQVTLRAEVPTPKGELLPGLYLRVRIE